MNFSNITTLLSKDKTPATLSTLYPFTNTVHKLLHKAKHIDHLLSVTWSKTECSMRHYLFILYFGLRMIQSAHIFSLDKTNFYCWLPRYYRNIFVMNKLYVWPTRGLVTSQSFFLEYYEEIFKKPSTLTM